MSFTAHSDPTAHHERLGRAVGGGLTILVLIAGALALAVFGHRQLDSPDGPTATVLAVDTRGPGPPRAVVTSGEPVPATFAWRVTSGRRDRKLYGARLRLQPGEERRIPLPGLPRSTIVRMRVAELNPGGTTREISIYPGKL